MKGIAGVSNTGPRTDGCLLMVSFVTFILLLFTLITASPERRHKADELLPENLVQLVNANDEVEEVRSQNNSIKSGEERSSKVWYNSYLELWFGRPAAPRRRELVQSFAEPPVPSAVASPIPSLASTFDSAPSDTEVPYAQHPASPPLQPFFLPVIDHSGLPPTADEQSSAAPSSASDSHSNRQKNSRKNVVIAVVVTSAVTFAVVALLFLCYRRLCGNRSGIGRNDESPLLNLSLSDYSISSSLQSTLGNPKDKEKPGNQSVYASSNHKNISSSLNKNFYSELDIVSKSKIETSSLGTRSSAVVTLSDDSAELSTSTLKPPPGRLGTFGKPPINSLPGRAPSSKTTPNKPDPSLLPSLPLVPPSTVNASSGCPCPPAGPPPPPSIPSGIKIARHPPPPPIEGVPPPRPPPLPVGGVPPPRPPPPPVGGVPPPRPPPPPAGGVPPPRPPPAPGGGMLPPRPPPVGLKPARPLPLGLDHPSASGSSEENAADAPKAKLKPFFWDKVLANPDHSMVWHQIKSGSFQFNEEMIETLFGYAPAEKRKNEHTKESSSQDPSTQYIQIIDPRKSQNLLILLKAMNVTTEEVCDALQEGDELPPEFLQTVLKMAPTAEEELKLRLYSGEISRLGPAERFLKMLVDIPFAFKRLESLLFMCNLEEDMSMVKESFATLEAACTELRKSRLFLKLLEAVLKTGNRMNDGTFRGGAQAFKLDTLLKLSDVKGTNGKTTLLHFVVQEMIRAEGIRAGRATEDSRGTSIVKSDDLLEDSSHDSEERYRSIGLQVVSSLGSELENVKKAAALDSDILAGTVAKLGLALIKARDFLNTDMKSIEEKNGFQQTLRSFVQNSEVDITWLKEEEKRIMTLVKNTADYFHGNSGKDEGLRLFVIVRDFLIILDKACNEVRNTFRKPNRMLRKDDSTATPFQSPPEPRQLLFPAIIDRRIDSSSSDDDNS